MMTPEEKLKICQSCEFLNTEGLKMFRDFCNKCGCYMPIKVHVPIAHCPINKW